MKKLLCKIIFIGFALALTVAGNKIYVNANEEECSKQIVTYYYDLENEELTLIENENARQIPEADLRLTFLISTFKNNNYVTRVNVCFQYEWLNLPVWRFTDRIAVAWNDSNFELDATSFEKHDYYRLTGSNEPVQHSYERRGTSFSEKGVSWDADLAGYQTTANSLYGWGGFNLVPKTNVSVGASLTLYAQYVHMWLNGSVTFTDKNGGGISVNYENADPAAIQIKETLK